MRNFAELMKRLLEIQRFETDRSPALIAEDQRLMDCLQKKSSRKKPAQTVRPSQGGRARQRLRA
jgi:hypothetical protein